jgi:hypothetical protein
MGNLKWVAHLFATQVLQTHLLRFSNNLISKIKFKEKHKMSTNKDLFKEAIADAKAVREAALANAKAALEEALTPKLHSMLAAKLEEMNDNGEEETLEEVDLISANDKRNDSDIRRKKAIDAGQMSEGEELEEDFDLSAILAELGDAEQVSDDAAIDAAETIDEAKEEETEEEETEDEESEEETETEETEIEDETEEDVKITDLTVDELKDIIKDIISAEIGAEAGMEMGAEDEMADMGDMGGEEATVDMVGGEEEIAEEEIDEVDLDELLAELDALDEADDKEEMDEAKKKEAKEDEKDEMKEAIETIEALRAELHEQNLLNAKLLYVNKIFKAKNLTESQKVKVIASFDKATTPAQAKELFESIQNSEIGAKKEIVKESLGFASKAAGVAPKKVIVESNDVISRMQKLANIK